MKKIIIFIFVLAIIIVVHTGEVMGHGGDLDTYKGHYIQNMNKECVGYHIHQGEYKGWQIDFDVPCKWYDRYNTFNKLKPFIPDKATAVGKWCKWSTKGSGVNVKFIDKLDVPTPTPKTTVIPTEDDIITPEPGVTNPKTGENSKNSKTPYIIIGCALVCAVVIYKVKTM